MSCTFCTSKLEHFLLEVCSFADYDFNVHASVCCAADYNFWSHVNSFQDGMEAANDAVYSYHSQKVMKTTVDSFKKSE